MDFSDYVLSDGITIQSTPTMSSITDLNAYTHAALTAMKRTLTINMGFMPDSKINELETLISRSYVAIKTNTGTKNYTSVTLSRTSSYIDNGEIWWDSVTVSGVEA